MEYIEVICNLKPGPHSGELLIMHLGEIGFESFEEGDGHILAYIPVDNFTESVKTALNSPKLAEFMTGFMWQIIPDQNWNAIWESQYDPVLIDNVCMVRAPFHQPVPGIEYDLVIMPKMSFGTAHHETTRQMIQYLLETDVKGRSVLDMGCGTAVLAILASKKGAASVEAVDNDEWAYNNALENVQGNNCTGISVFLGDAALLKGKKFDIILANINRNILLNDIKSYSACLNEKGYLYVSGFYTEDVDSISRTCETYGLNIVSKRELNRWTAVCYHR